MSQSLIQMVFNKYGLQEHPAFAWTRHATDMPSWAADASRFLGKRRPRLGSDRSARLSSAPSSPPKPSRFRRHDCLSVIFPDCPAKGPKRTPCVGAKMPRTRAHARSGTECEFHVAFFACRSTLQFRGPPIHGRHGCGFDSREASRLLEKVFARQEFVDDARRAQASQQHPAIAKRSHCSEASPLNLVTYLLRSRRTIVKIRIFTQPRDDGTHSLRKRKWAGVDSACPTPPAVAHPPTDEADHLTACDTNRTGTSGPAVLLPASSSLTHDNSSNFYAAGSPLCLGTTNAHDPAQHTRGPQIYLSAPALLLFLRPVPVFPPLLCRY